MLTDRTLIVHVARTLVAGVVRIAHASRDRRATAVVDLTDSIAFLAKLSFVIGLAGSSPAQVVGVAPTARHGEPIAAVDVAEFGLLLSFRHLHLRGHPAECERQFRARQTGLVDSRVQRFSDLAHDLASREGPVRLVGIDGCGGGGKTTFATRLSRALDSSPIIHTDDFASHDEPIEWWPAMLHDVVEPLMRREAASYRPYDWATRQRTEVVTVQPAPVVLIEGVGATRAAWRDKLVMHIWVDCPRDLRLQRGIARDGEALRDFWVGWMRAEDEYVAAERPYAFADITVDGASSATSGDAFVELRRVSEPR